MSTPLRFRIPSLLATRTVIAALKARWNVVQAPPVAVHRSFLDTADWRVYRAGWTLEVDRAPSGTRTEKISMALSGAESEALLVRTATDGTPTFAEDLPPVSPWAAVAAVVEDRRLLPQLEVDSHWHELSIRNDDDKTTAKISIAWHRLLDESGREHQLRMATVTPVRGYERTAERIADALRDAGLRPQERPLLPLALNILGRPQPGAQLGPGVELDRSMPAAEAVAAILGRLRYHVESNEAGVRQQLDIEFLHDYRVAIRRARSILRSVHRALPPDEAHALAAELGWLAQMTSAPRDLDVHLVELRSANGDLGPFNKYLTERRQVVQAELVAALDSVRYRQLIESWDALVGATGGSPSAPDANRPAGEEADALIARAYRRVLRRGGAIDAASPPEALHDLRKRAKELRYLLECFQSLYPEPARTSVIKELKALQDNLGEFQDCQVQAEAVRIMADDLLSSGAPASTLKAMAGMAETLEDRERRARLEFDARFSQFSSPANQRRMAKLVSGRTGSGRKKTGP